MTFSDLVLLACTFTMLVCMAISVGQRWYDWKHGKKLVVLLALLLLPSVLQAKPTVGGPVSPLDNKTAVAVDLPTELRKKNVGGKDGAGLCVFTSIMHAARWSSEHRLENFQDEMRKEPGGGYPGKVDAMVKKYGDGTPYVQYEGKDDSVIRAALKTGRMPGVTYNGHDPHYSGSISHMVNCVYLDDTQGCILDNNFIGEDELVWMTHDDFMQRWQGGGGGWAVVLLAPPPPPVPKPAAVQQLVGQPPPPVRGGLLSWYAPPEYPGQLWLFCDGEQQGGFDLYHGSYRPRYSSGQWGGPTMPPIPLPAPLSTDYGMSYVGGGPEGYQLDGKVVGKAEALAAIGADIPDDSGLLRVTVIGAEADTKAVLADLDAAPALAPFKGRLVVKAYDPAKPLDAPLLKCGLPATGKPTILVQSPSGAVRHHQEDYRDGADGLALALRKADPNYHPEQDPDKRNQLLPLDLPTEQIGSAMLLAAVGGAALLFRRKGK